MSTLSTQSTIIRADRLRCSEWLQKGARAGKSQLHVCVAVEIGPRRAPRLTLQGQHALDMGLEAGSKQCRDVGRNKPSA